MGAPDDVGEGRVGAEAGAGVLPGAAEPQYLFPSLRAAPHERPEQHAMLLHTVLSCPHCCPEATGEGVGAGVAPGAPGLSYHSHSVPQFAGPIVI